MDARDEARLTAVVEAYVLGGSDFDYLANPGVNAVVKSLTLTGTGWYDVDFFISWSAAITHYNLVARIRASDVSKTYLLFSPQSAAANSIHIPVRNLYVAVGLLADVYSSTGWTGTVWTAIMARKRASPA